MGKLSKKISTIALSSTMLFGTVTIQATSIFTTGKYTIPYFSTIEIKYHTYDENTSREEFIFWINKNQYNVICLDNQNDTKTIMVTVSDVNKRSAQSYKFDTNQQNASEILKEILARYPENNTSRISQTNSSRLLDKALLSCSENSSSVISSESSDSEENYKLIHKPETLKELGSQKTKRLKPSKSEENISQINHHHSVISPWAVTCEHCVKPGTTGKDKAKHYHTRLPSKDTTISLKCKDCGDVKVYINEDKVIEEIRKGTIDFHCSECKSYKDANKVYGILSENNHSGCGAGILCRTCKDRGEIFKAQHN